MICCHAVCQFPCTFHVFFQLFSKIFPCLLFCFPFHFLGDTSCFFIFRPVQYISLSRPLSKSFVLLFHCIPDFIRPPKKKVFFLLPPLIFVTLFVCLAISVLCFILNYSCSVFSGCSFFSGFVSDTFSWYRLATSGMFSLSNIIFSLTSCFGGFGFLAVLWAGASPKILMACS